MNENFRFCEKLRWLWHDCGTVGRRPQLVGLPILRLIYVLLILNGLVSIGMSGDNRNRTLLGNRAVQRELKLSEEQQAKIDKILAEIEEEIERGVKATGVTKQDAPDKFASVEARIAESIIAEHTSRLQAILDQGQALRLWQIGAQASGPDVFYHNRTKRVLNFTRPQLERMAELSDKMVEEVKQLATDVDMDLKEIKQRVVLANKKLFDATLALLSAQQRQSFDQLLGPPFDLELLERADGVKPRSLTFIHGLSGQNQYILANSSETRRQLGLTGEQSEKIQSLVKKADEDLTELRLGTLKSTKVDFAELGLDEKRQVVRTILDGAVQ